MGADNSADKIFERVHLNVSSNSVENVTGCKQFKNAFSSAVENIIDVGISHTSNSYILGHQSKFLNISSKLTHIVIGEKIGLQEMKGNSPDKLILGHVNVNSVRNKFHALTYITDNNIDIILISETKIDDAFPTAHFFNKGFRARYRQGRNRTGGGLVLLVREDVTSRILNPKSKIDTETLSVIINLRKRKWFLNCSYNPRKNQLSNHLECLNRLIAEYNTFYESFIFMGFQYKCRRKSNLKCLQFKLSRESDTRTNICIDLT